MTIAFYMDVHVPRAITIGLRELGVDVLTSQEDETAEWEDHDLSRSPRLQQILDEARADYKQHGGVSLDQVKARLAGTEAGTAVPD